jgi:restriction endonuclease S subunit
MLSEVKKENLEFRFDSEYFGKEYLKLDKTINSLEFDYVSNFANVTDGIHESIEFDDNSIINLISAKSPKANYFDLSGNGFISKSQHLKNQRTALRTGDIILSTVGTIGNCAVVDDTILPANCDRHVGIIRVNKRYNPYFISTFMLTKYGLYQSYRHSTGNVQLNLFIYKMKNIKIPYISERFQNIIAKTISEALDYLKNSKAFYKQAEELLLSELNLDKFVPSSEKVTVKNFSESFGISGRLDAEYYQPKYDELEVLIKRHKTVKIKDIINYPVCSGLTPKAGGDAYCDKENGIPFIRAVDIINSTVRTSDLIYIKDEIHNGLLKRTKLIKNDVLFSIAGTVGRCGIFEHDFEANINQAVSILRFDESIIKRLYLITYFNSNIGNIYVSKYSRQGLQTNLNLDEVSNLEIPVLDMKTQEIISELIRKTFSQIKRSEELLEMAKKAVEIAIEKNETTSINWLENGGLL